MSERSHRGCITGGKGAALLGPTPYGTCADIEGIAKACHERDKPLIVDEAWGAHLPFHDDLPTWAMDAHADICVVSVHKMGAGFERGRSSTSKATWSTPTTSPTALTC